MRFEVNLAKAPRGMAEEDIAEGASGRVATRFFLSTEDGQKFVLCTEGVIGGILRELPIRIPPSQIDHLLAIIRRDGTASVFVNDIPISFMGVPRRDLKAGDGVSIDDLYQINSVTLGDIEIPVDAGVVFLFSLGWRKGLYFDMMPVVDHAIDRSDTNFADLCGQLYSALAFQERLKLSDQDWDALLRREWFPFAGMPLDLLKQVIVHARQNWDESKVVDKCELLLQSHVPAAIQAWSNYPAFLNHSPILQRAWDHFANSDWLSCIALLAPRIEGILRDYLDRVKPATKPTQSELARASMHEHMDSFASVLLPQRFVDYLMSSHFKPFSKGTIADATRHAVAHGVADPLEFTKKRAVLDWFVIWQLSLSFRADTTT